MRQLALSPEQRAVRAARLRALNADPVFRARKVAAIRAACAAGRRQPLKIPAHAHPLVRQFFTLVNREQAPLADISSRAGVGIDTMRFWRRRHMPRLDVFEAALNALDHELCIRPRKAPR